MGLRLRGECGLVYSFLGSFKLDVVARWEVEMYAFNTGSCWVDREMAAWWCSLSSRPSQPFLTGTWREICFEYSIESGHMVDNLESIATVIIIT